MHQLRLIGLLLRPSLLSFIVCVVLAIGILGVINWSYLTQSELFYDYFYGRYGVVAALQNAPDSFSGLSAAIFSKPLTYNVVILLGSIAIGLMVYVILQSLNRWIVAIMSTEQDIAVAQQLSKKSVQKEIGVRLAVRLVTIVAWFFYWTFSVKVLLPFCILATRTGVSELAQWSGWVYSLLAFSLLVAGLHLHVIFARLLLLRPRLFGGREAIEAVEFYGR